MNSDIMCMTHLINCKIVIYVDCDLVFKVLSTSQQNIHQIALKLLDLKGNLSSCQPLSYNKAWWKSIYM